MLGWSEGLFVPRKKLLGAVLQTLRRDCRARCWRSEAICCCDCSPVTVLRILHLLYAVAALVVHHPLCHQLQSMLQGIRIGVLLLRDSALFRRYVIEVLMMQVIGARLENEEQSGRIQTNTGVLRDLQQSLPYQKAMFMACMKLLCHLSGLKHHYF